MKDLLGPLVLVGLGAVPRAPPAPRQPVSPPIPPGETHQGSLNSHYDMK